MDMYNMILDGDFQTFYVKAQKMAGKIFVHMQNSLYSTFSNDLVPVYA